MLLVLLGGVTLLMRRLQQPPSAELLGQALAMPAQSSKDESASAAVRTPPPGDPQAWSAIRDNALFLPQEEAAWFALLDEVRAESNAQPTAVLPEVAYAQLAGQPEAYRGQPVRIRGTVVRESVKRVPRNDLGLIDYHQLVVAPRGGGEWPIVVYALDLPEDFPRGDGLRAAVTIDGRFFKVWSFAHEDGAGLAPVIVARHIDWQPTDVTAAASASTAPIGLGTSLFLGATFAAVVVAWVIWQTRRPRRTSVPAAVDATRDALRRLGDAEGEP